MISPPRSSYPARLVGEDHSRLKLVRHPVGDEDLVEGRLDPGVEGQLGDRPGTHALR